MGQPTAATPYVLNPGQREAFAAAMSGENVFITGGAGVGKSYLSSAIVDALREQGKGVVVCAPTGKAALEVGGSTIHKAFDLPVGPLVETNRRMPRLFRTANLPAIDAVLIDEISMCRIDLFEAVADVLHRASATRVLNFQLAPIQLILVGDFAQLPPVLNAKTEDAEILARCFDADLSVGAYAFLAPSWGSFGFKVYELTDIVRQADHDFSSALNAVRRGEWAGVDWCAKHASPSPIDDAVFLLGRNKTVSQMNADALHRLCGTTRKYYAEKKGAVPKSCPVDDVVELATGARVMMASNDSEGRWANGQTGTVTGFVPSSKGDGVVPCVDLDTGGSYEVAPKSWSMSRYSVIETEDDHGTPVVELKEEVVVSYSQIPLRLAYAVTVHRAQGATLDAANIDPVFWDAGQLYVALSRVREVSGLYLLRPPRRRSLKCSPVVADFYGWD